jgi:hypothetical protein
MASKFIYPDILPEHPIPETATVFLSFQPSSLIAMATIFNTEPMPQPGHHV